jgi:hypothetical protein
MVFPPRVRQILELRATGMSYKQIGWRLHLTELTVKAYLNACGKRFKASPAELTAEFIRREFRDFMRLRALEIDSWLKRYGETLPAPARAAMETIMAESVKEIF